MRSSKSRLTVSAIACGCLTAMSVMPAFAVPPAPSKPAFERSAAPVAYRSFRGDRGDHRNYGYSHRRHRGIGGGAIVGGIIAGALIAGAIRESRADSSDVSRCEDAYRSFDLATGTYVGYDGERHVCPYLE